MANAETRIKKIAKPVEYDEVQVVNLELTIQEAMFLSAITSKIGGDPSNSMRKLSDSIRDALAPIVGRREFTNNAWHSNRSVGLAFGSNTDPELHTIDVQQQYSW